MRLDEIKKLYHTEWLLIEVQKFDKDYHVVEGEILISSPSREEIYQALLNHPGKNLAIEYCN